MSHNPSERRSPPYLSILLVGALLSGGAFFWSNWKPATAPNVGDSVAFAAPKPGSSTGAKPRPATKAERASVVKTISTQLKAFKENNWPEAVKFQSEGLKGNFPTPDAFGEMIVKIYPAFVNPKKVEFGKALNVGGHVQIEVNLTGQDDSVTSVLYSLAKEKGNYRIEAVAGGVTLPADGPSAAV